MNPKTGKIARARKMAREQAARFIKPGDPGYWAKVDEIFHRLMREQLAFEDYLAARGPQKNPTAPRCPYCGTRMRSHGRRYVCPDPECGYVGTSADIHRVERTAGAYETPDFMFNPQSSPPPPPSRRKKGGGGGEDIDPTPYERFHGVSPDRVEGRRGWVPGEMVLLGQAVDEGYKAKDRRSNKGPGPYVHDNGSGVRVWRRAGRNETPDKVWSSFPTELTLMGTALGFTYRDDKGKLHEVKGGSKKMYTTPSRRMLVIMDSTGVKYVIEGGNLYVDDWIRN